MKTNLHNESSEITVATQPFVDSFEYHFDMPISISGRFDYTSKEIKIDYGLIDAAKLVIFTGGEDINPLLYGQENTHSSYSVERDAIEKRIFKYAFSIGKKMLGVCRGHQLINALMGGLLVQDITHYLGTRHPGRHALEPIVENSKVVPLFSRGVNSLHHQGVIKVGDGLWGTSMYGKVYESTENDEIITTQFHPEFMDSYSDDFFKMVLNWAGIDSKILGN